MHIMTIHGWRQLSVNCTLLPPAAVERNGYVGRIPSADICAFHNSLKDRMKFFDDGVRMVYGRADKIVEVDNDTPIHPIPYPPAGFEQTVRLKSRYE